VEKARTTGADVKNPKRHAGRTAPSTGPLGGPSEWLGGEQRVAWKQFTSEMPWLKESHRALVEIACTIRARLMTGEEVGVQALNLLRQALGQMGGTPTDESKVRRAEDEEADPADAYLN
jgi:hypothetical protein